MVVPSSYDSDASSDSDGIFIPPDSPSARHGTLEQRLATGWTPPLPPGPAPAFAFRSGPAGSKGGDSNKQRGSHMPEDDPPLDEARRHDASRDAHNVQETNHRPPQSGSQANIDTISGQPAIMTGATISAEPQLRDMKKEVTAFVPTAVRRKQEAAATGKGTAGSS